MTHAPVLLREAIAAAAPQDGDLILDGTFGGGGYTRALLDAARCRVIAVDRDPEAVDRARALAQERPGAVVPAEGRFGELDQLAGEPVDAVLLDVGVSSYQLDAAMRGFSFRFDAPLDMRMEARGPSADDAVNALSEAALAELLRDYGEERESRRMARFIVAARAKEPIRSTARLAALLEEAVGGRRGARLHPATRAFQALRMLVNDELGELARGLAAAERCLKPGGRLVVVSFHSLEDRLVKSFLLDRSGQGGRGSRYAPDAPQPPATFEMASRRAVEPSEAEIAENPRARSAKLRSAVRTSAPARGEWPAEDLAARAREEGERLR